MWTEFSGSPLYEQCLENSVEVSPKSPWQLVGDISFLNINPARKLLQTVPPDRELHPQFGTEQNISSNLSLWLILPGCSNHDAVFF